MGGVLKSALGLLPRAVKSGDGMLYNTITDVQNEEVTVTVRKITPKKQQHLPAVR